MKAFAIFAVVLTVWLSLLHLVLRPQPDRLRVQLAAGQRTFWRAPDLDALRRNNPEWELMARMFSVLAFANLSLDADPDALPALDGIVEGTEALEREHGPTYFLLPYGAAAKQSLFVDGELGLMLAVRQLLEPGADARALRERVARIERQLNDSPLLLAESYPDEGWTFCNTVALAALRVSDAALGTDHSPLLERWVASARAHLIDPTTGMLISSFHQSGAPRDGPEGSTLWLAAHMLQLVDERLAAEQYALAREKLGHDALGFGWAAEWPREWPGRDDVDSGPTIPLVDANAGSSGLAVLGAAAFHDEEYESELLTSLELAAFPVGAGGGMRFAAGNALADAVVLYALAQGPLWSCVKGGPRCSVPRS